jgi:hypothetical protein
MATDPITSTEYQTTETWLWILISRPLVSIDINDNSTHVPFPSQSSYEVFIDTPSPPYLIRPPPNYPFPAPTSWVVFAVPKAHVTVYDISTEQHSSSSSTSLLGKRDRSSRYGFSAEKGDRKVTRRRDYDFSHAGLPIFEFSSATLFPSRSSPLPFLSIERLGPFSPSDRYELLPASVYASLKAQDAANRKADKMMSEMRGKKTALEGAVGEPCPYEGHWWGRFWEEMWEDARRWKGIREAMGRGSCRVVLRWEEWEVQDLEMRTERMGVDVGGNRNTGTRTSERRHSGLGRVETPQGTMVRAKDKVKLKEQ